MIRWLKFHSFKLRRRYKRSDETWLSRLLHSELVQWNRQTATRGVAVGMFWTFAPMPFQMLPAALFCWLVRGNLPLAILCVWLTNPVTLPPVILLEYRIGEFILEMITGVEESIVEDSTMLAVFTGGLRLVLIGSLALSSTMMVVFYLLMHLAFTLSERSFRRRQSRSGAGSAKAAEEGLERREASGPDKGPACPPAGRKRPREPDG